VNVENEPPETERPRPEGINYYKGRLDRGTFVRGTRRGVVVKRDGCIDLK